MSLIRFGRGREYLFFRRGDLRTRWDLQSAQQFLKRFQGDERSMALLRRNANISSAGSKVSEEQVIETLARMLVSGELIVAMPAREELGAVLGQQPERATEAAPRGPTAREQEPEPPTFGPSHNGRLQAATLLAAAQSGMPFCEECERGESEEEEPAAA